MAKDFAIVTFIDIKGASNNTSGVIIETTLSRYELSGSMITVFNADTTIGVWVISGYPEDEVLSLLLWKQVMNELSDEIVGQFCKLVR